MKVAIASADFCMVLEGALWMKKKLVTALVVALICLLSACAGSTSSGGDSPPKSVGKVTATISGLGSLPGEFDTYGMAADDTAVWVHNGDGDDVIRIDPKTNSQVADIAVGSGPGGIAIGEGSVWVANSQDNTISRIDPNTNKVVATIRLNGEVDEIAVSSGAVWATDYNDSEILRIDPTTNKVIATIPNQIGVSDVSADAGSTWVANRGDTAHGLTRVNTTTNQVEAQIDTANGNGLSCTAVVALAQSIWTVDLVLGDGSSVVVERVDPTTNKVVATIPTPDAVPFQFAADAHGVWVYGPDTGLYRIDPQTNRVIGKLTMTGGAGVALGAGSVWFANGQDGTLMRITPAS
jgi:YVTN family beta-propeller protein